MGALLVKAARLCDPRDVPVDSILRSRVQFLACLAVTITAAVLSASGASPASSHVSSGSFAPTTSFRFGFAGPGRLTITDVAIRVRSTSGAPPRRLGGLAFTIADNESPLPQDRVFVAFNYFKGAAGNTETSASTRPSSTAIT